MDERGIEALSNDELRDLLIQHGQPMVGPVVKTTRKVYENKLKKIMGLGTVSSPSRRSGAAANLSQVPSTPSTPNDRVNTSTTISTSPDRRSQGGAVGSTAFSPWSSGSRNTYGDSSRHDPDDDLMEGEESFRYVGPVNDDSSSSPYSALGGSMIATPPRTANPSFTSTPAARTDFGSLFKDNRSTYSPPSKPSTYGFTAPLADGGASTKSSTISYHTSGGGLGTKGLSSGTTEPYRRVTHQSPAVAPRTAAPRIPYAGASEPSKDLGDLVGVDTRGVWAKAKPWLPWVVKLLMAIVAIIFIAMVVKRAMRSGMGDEEDESFQLPP